MGTRIALAALLASAVACSSGPSTPAGGTTPRPSYPPPSTRVGPGKVVPPTGPAIPATDPQTAPGAMTCAGPGELVCQSVCCPAGSTCVAGECHLAIEVQACPPEAPVTCEAAPSCAAGCVAADDSGRGNHLAVTAPAGFVAGRSGGGVALQRTTAGPDLIQGPGGDLPQGDRTFEVWILPDSRDGWQTVLSYGVHKLAILRDPSGGAPDQIEFTGCMLVVPSKWPSGRWVFLAATVSATSTRLHVDGALVGACGGGAATGAGGLSLGLGVGYVFAGALDELRIVDRALSDAEVAADALLAVLPVVPGTRGLWRFDEGAARRCCPAASTCGAGGECEVAALPITCPQTHPIACSGFCCPVGASCGAGVCIVAGTPPSCDVPCGDGTCCPAGRVCAGNACVAAVPIPAANPCPAGDLAVADPGGGLRCCHDPGGGNAVAFTSQGACWGCYIASGPGASPYPGCASGYAACGGTCIRGDDGAAACGGGTACGGTTSAQPGGCCPADSACTGDGSCCPGGSTGCGGSPCAACAGACCSAAQCGAGTCTIPKGGCALGAICGTACCPDGTVCVDGACAAPAAAPSLCAPGVDCGNVCCPQGDLCLAPGLCGAAAELPPACAPALPVTCAGDLGCCPAGYECTGPGGTCHHVTAKPVPTGPTGPRCSNTTACAPGEVCAGDGCCPSTYPVGCGSECCLPGAACSAGVCGCPDGRAACGGQCCGIGTACVNGACVAECATTTYPLACGLSCCAADLTCAGGTCVCPAGHPTPCGNDCCQQDACTSGRCACPAQQPLECGRFCCSQGQACLRCDGETELRCHDGPCPVVCPPGSVDVGGACACSTPGHTVQACPGGSKKCCLDGMRCCTSMFGGAADCYPPSFCAN